MKVYQELEKQFIKGFSKKIQGWSIFSSDSKIRKKDYSTRERKSMSMPFSQFAR